MVSVELDPLEYLNVPYMSGRATLALAHALHDNAPPPQQRSKQVEVTLAQLVEVAAKLEADFANRVREASSEVLALEGELDGAADGAFVGIRDRLQSFERYDRPGFHRLAEDPEAKVDYAALVDRGKRARVLRAKLFSGEGLAVLRRTYAEQVVSTAAILRVVEEDGLAAQLEAVLGEDVMPMLKDLQQRYEAMIATRSARESAVTLIHQHRAELRGAIKHYATAVLGMLDPTDADSVKGVEGILQPILGFRDRYVSGPSVAADAEDELGDDLEAQAPPEDQDQAP